MAKQNTSYNRTVQYLNKVMKLIDEEFFDNELNGTYTITIQSTVGAYGHVTTSKVWQTENGNASYELNIGADYLMNREFGIVSTVSTLIHEGVHIYCMLHNIKDTSNRGIYHNSRFKEEAEKRGLIISRHEKYGWTITEPGERVVDFCINNDLQEIMVGRNTGWMFTGIGTGKAGNDGLAPVPPKTKKPSSSRKYICPCCHNSFRATKEIRVMCMDCNEQFILA